MAKKSDNSLVEYARFLAKLEAALAKYVAKIEFRETQVIRVATRQAARFYDVCTLAAEANRVVSELSLKRDRLESELRVVIRHNAEKMTEKAVDAALLADAGYCKILEMIIAAKRVAELASGLQAAYKDRSYMIRAVVDTLKNEQGGK